MHLLISRGGGKWRGQWGIAPLLSKAKIGFVLLIYSLKCLDFDVYNDC